MMPELLLTDIEVWTLKETLESSLSDLRMEVADTDLMDFRENLKEKEIVLKNILKKLK